MSQYSRYTRFPSNIHFYCVKKAPKGGATPIAHSANIYEKVAAAIPELIEGVHARGLAMKMVFKAPGQEVQVNPFNWAGIYSFGQELQDGDDAATTRAKVEKQVRRLTDDFTWQPDNSLEVVQHIPGLRRDPANQRPTWFNGLVGRHGMTRDIGALEPPHVGRDGMTCKSFFFLLLCLLLSSPPPCILRSLLCPKTNTGRSALRVRRRYADPPRVSR